MPTSEEIDFTEAQKLTANLIASTLCNGGPEALLEAQSDLLKGVEAAIGEWLHRRQEAIADAHRLVTRLRESRDVSDIWQAQQEWAAGAMQRFAADFAAYPALLARGGRHAAETATEGAQRTVQEAQHVASEVTRRTPDVLSEPPRTPKILPSEAAQTPAAEEMQTH